MDDVDEIVGCVEDDVIKRASFLLFVLVKRETVGSAVGKVSSYLRRNGWLLRVDDKDFLEKIGHRSLRDVEKWVDYNLKKL